MNESITQYGQIPSHYSTHDEIEAEAEVLAFLDDFTYAVRSGDLDRIMSFYSDDVVAFDMMPPLRFVGAGMCREIWKEYFTDYFKFPVSFSYSEQKIVAVGDVAYSFGLIHVAGTGKSNHQKVDHWIRNTTCVQKRDGEWKIIHEHNSVPINSESGKGMMELTPY